MFKFNFVTPEDDSNYAENAPRVCNLPDERKCKIKPYEQLSSNQTKYFMNKITFSRK